MSNIIYDGSLYNENLKKEYISTHKQGTQNNLERIFKMTKQAEEDLGKDLYEFNREELRKTFFTFMASTKGSSKSMVSLVISYIDWAIEEGLLEGSNPLESVGLAWKEQFVVQPDKVFFTDTEIKTMLSKIVNAQVAVTFYAPFMGVRGADNAEIVNLKKSDVNVEDSTLSLRDSDGSTRVIKVDEQLISLCEAAIKEDELIKSNGEPDANIRSESIDLISNDYVIRSADINTKNVNEAAGSIVYRRFKTLEEYFGDKRISPMVVSYSGMLAMAKDLHLQGKLDKEGYNLIAKQFNLSDATLRRHQKDFLNLSNIKSVYNIS